MRVAVVIMLLIQPAAAQVVQLERPADCKPQLTVQFAGCLVGTFLRCGSDGAAGWRHEEYDDTGLISVEVNTPDYKLVGAIEADGSLEVRGYPDEEISIPPSEARNAGSRQFVQRSDARIFVDFWFTGTLYGTVRFVGDTTLPSGDVVEEFAMAGEFRLPPPADPIQTTATLYFDPSSGAAFFGPVLSNFPLEPVDEIPKQPMSLHRTPKGGLDRNTPIHDCPALSFLGLRWEHHA